MIWRLAVDTGGTFTDCLATDPNGRRQRVKVLSNGSLRGRVIAARDGRTVAVEQSWNAPGDFVRGYRFFSAADPDGIEIDSFEPGAGLLHLVDNAGVAAAGEPFFVTANEEAPILAARLVTRTLLGDPLPAMAMRLATTRGTNALLEKKGAKTAFFVTSGFADLLRIGNQKRPDLFTLHIRKPEPLHAEVIEVKERLAADGSVVEALDEASLAGIAARLRGNGVEAAAVALLHAYRNPDHEKRLKRILEEAGFSFVSASHELAPFIRILPRAETALADACLSPVLNGYLDRVQDALGESPVLVMTSAGGLVSRAVFRPKDSLLSGPAGGVVGAAAIGRQAGFSRVIAFDMGGTSTDVARFDGDFDYRFEHSIGDVRLMAPALRIESVAAGGGSICRFDGRALTVGPDSAGADPGPACYGGGGPLTITDAHLLLGRIAPERFGFPVFPEKARQRLGEVMAALRNTGGELPDERAVLEGFLAIANERMADAIRQISIREGYDPSEYAMVAFGGAGGLHACGVGRLLGIDTVVFPEDAGLLSARGLQRAMRERIVERQVLQPLGKCSARLDGWLDEMAAEGRRDLEAEADMEGARTQVRRRIAQVRLEGQDSSLAVDVRDSRTLERDFEERYREVFGYVPRERAVELVSLRVIVSTVPPADEAETFGEVGKPASGRAGDVRNREDLKPGDRLLGPCIIQDRFSTLAIDSGWTALVGGRGTICLNRMARTAGQPVIESAGADVVDRELFANRFRTIAEEMGLQLQRTALSTNVKERLDFSCALLDEKGSLVVNAPHVPVHLGALGVCVRETLKDWTPKPGDVLITNHPKWGGSHLPDVTLISPVFSGDRVIVFVANRAHHAEIGGRVPGSMSPAARFLAEEGVAIPPMLLFDGGEERFDEVERLLRSGRYPSRAVPENLADIRAQVAANIRGVEAVSALVRQCGDETVRRRLRQLHDDAATAARAFIADLPARVGKAACRLDDGAALRVVVEKSDSGELTVDFTGSGGTHPASFNATPAIVQSVIIYSIRVLLGKEIPLNEGLLDAVRTILPEGLLNPRFPGSPAECPAVAAGNVETSQRLANLLLLAFRACAASQGTMNNFLFGGESYSHYETICGGSGAGPGFDGADAVHTHMTNTAITDPEILEQRYPIRLRRFAVRRGSGGEGRYRGGDGAVREFEFLDTMQISLLTQHRVEGPPGAAGGNAGLAGRQILWRQNGTVERLPFSGERQVRSGDVLTIETPGGGGWGRREK